MSTLVRSSPGCLLAALLLGGCAEPAPMIGAVAPMPPGRRGLLVSIPPQRSARDEGLSPAVKGDALGRTSARQGTAQAPGPVVLMHGNLSRPEVALTFDDGPHPTYTVKLLELLKRYNIRATFFIVGKRAIECPHLVRAIREAGHEVANHTYNHRKLTNLPSDQVAREISEAGELVKRETGQAPRFFRPPGGHYDDRVLTIARNLGYVTVLWTANSGDWAPMPTVQLQRRILSRTGPGGIILCHDGITANLHVLPSVIETLRARGYQFVTIGEMLERRSQPGPLKPQVIRVSHRRRHRWSRYHRY